MFAVLLDRPLWSEAILEELMEHESLKRQRRGVQLGLADAAAAHLIDRMRAEFDDAIVTGWSALEGSFGLPDPDDEHVVASAVVGGAGAIVTANLRDFPTASLPQNVQVLAPRDFAADTVSVDPDRATLALQEIARRYRRSAGRPPDRPADRNTRDSKVQFGFLPDRNTRGGSTSPGASTSTSPHGWSPPWIRKPTGSESPARR